MNGALILDGRLSALTLPFDTGDRFTSSQLNLPRAESMSALGLLDFGIEAFSWTQAVYSTWLYNPAISISCKVVLCGQHAFCGENDICQCNPGYDFVNASILSGPDASCSPSPASLAQQNAFFAISFWLANLSLLASTTLLMLYYKNAKLHSSSDVVFLCNVLPDFVISFTFCLSQLLNLTAAILDGPACQGFGVIFYAAVIASLFSPVILSGNTLYFVYKAGRGLVQKSSTVGIKFALAIPWIAGCILALVAESMGLLGSFRGLYCFARSWDAYLTGGIIFTFMSINLVLTLISYIAVCFMLRGSRGANNPNATASLKAALTGLFKRGGSLVFAYICSWFLWALAGFRNYTGAPLSVSVELYGALIFLCQPLANFYLLNRIPVFAELLSALVLDLAVIKVPNRAAGMSIKISLSGKTLGAPERVQTSGAIEMRPFHVTENSVVKQPDANKPRLLLNSNTESDMATEPFDETQT